jgi:hypothetical protein
VRDVEIVVPGAARSTLRTYVMRNVDRPARCAVRLTSRTPPGHRPRVGERLTGR